MPFAPFGRVLGFRRRSGLAMVVLLREPLVNLSDTTYGVRLDGGVCPSSAGSGADGWLTIDAIDSGSIRGRLDKLNAFSEPNLPKGQIPFEAIRCPGDWKNVS